MTPIVSHDVPVPIRDRGARGTPASNPVARDVDATHPAFASLLDPRRGAPPQAESRPGPEPDADRVEPPAQAFDAFGPFGRTHSISDGAVAPDAVVLGQAPRADQDRAPHAPAASPAVSASAPSTTTPIPTLVERDPAGDRRIPLTRYRPTGSLLLQASFPRSTQAISRMSGADDDRSASPDVDPSRKTIERPEPAPVSLILSGEGPSVQIIARGGGGDPEDRDALRDLAEQVAGEFGISVESLQLDGAPVPSKPFAIGDQYGR